MKVKIKKLHPEAIIPKYAKPGDAAMDLTAISYEFKDGRHVYGTGISLEIPDGHVGLIFPRSSICKMDLRLTNSVGVIDSKYRGEIKFFFENDAMEHRRAYEKDIAVYTGIYEGKTRYTHSIYEVGDRIGQLMIIPYPTVEFEEVNELSLTERGTGGFGHTGRGK